MNKVKVSVVVSHPIQHFVPQYKSWSNIDNIDLKVFFASQHGLKPYHDKNFGREVKWEGMNLDFKHEFLNGSEDRKLGNNIDSNDLETKLESINPKILIVYGYVQKLQRRAIKWANENNIKVCMISDSELRTQRSLYKQLIKKIVLPSIYNKINYFFTVGDANEAYYKNYGVKDTQLLRTFFPIDIDHYDNILNNYNVSRNDIRNKLNIPSNHKVILNVGKLVSWKRQVDLVELSNKLQNNIDNNITIVLAGTGPDEDKLKKLCKNSGIGGVIFAGFILPNVLSSYYCASDMYIHCSEHEPHSLAISEALYCGKPIMVSDKCGSYGPSDDVRNGLNGYVYKCGNIEDMKNKIEHIFGNPKLEEKMGKNSENFSRVNQSLAHGKSLEQALNLINCEK